MQSSKKTAHSGLEDQGAALDRKMAGALVGLLRCDNDDNGEICSVSGDIHGAKDLRKLSRIVCGKIRGNLAQITGTRNRHEQQRVVFARLCKWRDAEHVLWRSHGLWFLDPEFAQRHQEASRSLRSKMRAPRSHKEKYLNRHPAAA